MNRLSAMSLAETAHGLVERRFSSEELVTACLERIAERDAEVAAWIYLDAEAVIEQARLRDSEPPRGLLHGVPIGIKDIIDTSDTPTERGCTAFRDRRPSVDAVCVQRLREAGAIIMGKTVTTELAYFAPGPTTNPHDSRHTPGGSSSGSAAAVADFHVPAALGSQTAGSVIRPASYCGVFGFKPTFDAWDYLGVAHLAATLDTLGAFTREVPDLDLLFTVFGGQAAPEVASRHRVGLARTHLWEQASAESRKAIEALCHRLAGNGYSVDEVKLDGQFTDLWQQQANLQALEASREFAGLVVEHGSELAPQTLALVDQGRELEGQGWSLDTGLLEGCRDTIEECFGRVDLILTPGCQGDAPAGLDATGDPMFNRIWTLLGTPCLSMPIGLSAAGLPLGVQAIGPRGRDREMLVRCQELVEAADGEIAVRQPLRRSGG